MRLHEHEVQNISIVVIFVETGAILDNLPFIAFERAITSGQYILS